MCTKRLMEFSQNHSTFSCLLLKTVVVIDIYFFFYHFFFQNLHLFTHRNLPRTCQDCLLVKIRLLGILNVKYIAKFLFQFLSLHPFGRPTTWHHFQTDVMIIKGHQNRKYLHSINNFTKTKNICIQFII